MKKIVALLFENSNSEIVVNSAIQMAKILNLEIVLCHLIDAPQHWERLGRSQRDKYPLEKQIINNVRSLLDELLAEIRKEGVIVKKRFLFYGELNEPTALHFDADDLIIIKKDDFELLNQIKLNDILFKNAPAKLLLIKEFDSNSISDIVLASSFHNFKSNTARLIHQMSHPTSVSLNLVFINSKCTQENSEISINNMKETIANHGFSRTKISIFYSDLKMEGVEAFAEMKGGDLIVMEGSQQMLQEELKYLNRTLLILH